MVDRSLPRVVLSGPAQSGWNLEFHPQSAWPHAVSSITVNFNHRLLEMSRPSTFPPVTLEGGAPPKGKLTVPLRLKEGVTVPTEITDGTLTIHYIDASNAQVYWQPFKCRAGANTDKGPFFELSQQGPIDTDGPGVWGVRRRILRFLRDRERTGSSSPRSDVIAEALQIELADLNEDLERLAAGDYVEIQRWQYKGTVTILITPRGKEVAREGWPRGADGVPGPVYHTTFIGDVQNAAVGNIGPTTQNVGSDAEFRRILDELKGALVELAKDDDDREDRERAVNRVSRELASAEPNLTLGRRAWESVVAFATVEGTIQGIERISKALLPLVPLVSQWYGGSPPLPPGMMA